MSYYLDFSQQAKSGIDFHKKQAIRLFWRKLFVLLDELTKHPFTGTGKPEQLKYILAGSWSRRINQEHRLIYEDMDDTVLIYSAKGHYWICLNEKRSAFGVWKVWSLKSQISWLQDKNHKVTISISQIWLSHCL